VNPASRVQWVSSWKPQPKRWLGNETGQYAQTISLIESGAYDQALQTLTAETARDASAAIIAADLLIFQGDNEKAASLLAPFLNSAPQDPRIQDPRIVSLYAHALVRLDRLPEAETLLLSAINATPDNIDLLLAHGEISLIDGQVSPAREDYLAVIRKDPSNAEAWYGLGLIESERENVKRARELLGKALDKNAQYTKAQAELASAETFAGNFAAADKLLLDVLSREPDNYVALTALGLSQLKAGHTRDALDDFLKAGVIEPHYARAWLYSGVAFYQLGERARAIQAFQKAAELDAKDPVPHLL
jgi:Flp pilus assembly protein TadD